jgi:hypothetical protein
MSDSNVKGSTLIVVVLSGVTEDEAKQAASAMKSATAMAASAIGCDAGGMHQFLRHAFGVRDMIDTHMTAMRHVAEAVEAHDKGECDCDAHSERSPESRVLVNARGGES